jgi:hypothetical protein
MKVLVDKKRYYGVVIETLKGNIITIKRLREMIVI